MSKIIFIIGGARSGKSRHALKLANGKKIAFIATCQPLDKEMKKRIALHKKARPLNWQTFEEFHDIPALLKKIGNKFDVILIDCLTLLITNLLLKKYNSGEIENEIKKILSVLKTIKAKSIIVSNELGLGIVPRNKLAREFRDIAGRVNQIAASGSDQVFFMIAGIPLKIKDNISLIPPLKKGD